MNRRPEWDDEGRDWPNRQHSLFVRAGRMAWHVQIMGEGPPVLLLHGTGAATHSWRDLAPMLARKFTVIAPDLPGHGFTRGRAGGGMTIPAFARAVGELLHVLDVRPTLTVSHSAGTAVAARLMLDGTAPVPALGFCSALTPFPGAAAKVFPFLARALFVNPFVPSIFARIARQPGEAEKFLIRSTGSRIDARGTELYRRLFATPEHCAAAIEMMADWDLDSLWPQLPRLPAPLWLAHGERDAAVPLDRAREVPAARLIVMDGLGHLAHEERPDLAAALIEEFAATSRVLAPAHAGA